MNISLLSPLLGFRNFFVFQFVHHGISEETAVNPPAPPSYAVSEKSRGAVMRAENAASWSQFLAFLVGKEWTVFKLGATLRPYSYPLDKAVNHLIQIVLRLPTPLVSGLAVVYRSDKIVDEVLYIRIRMEINLRAMDFATYRIGQITGTGSWGQAVHNVVDSLDVSQRSLA
jgi:hypothetical protein